MGEVSAVSQAYNEEIERLAFAVGRLHDYLMFLPLVGANSDPVNELIIEKLKVVNGKLAEIGAFLEWDEWDHEWDE